MMAFSLHLPALNYLDLYSSLQHGMWSSVQFVWQPAVNYSWSSTHSVVGLCESSVLDGLSVIADRLQWGSNAKNCTPAGMDATFEVCPGDHCGDLTSCCLVLCV